MGLKVLWYSQGRLVVSGINGYPAQVEKDNVHLLLRSVETKSSHLPGYRGLKPLADLFLQQLAYFVAANLSR